MADKKPAPKTTTSTQPTKPAAVAQPATSAPAASNGKSNGLAVAALILVIIGIFVPGLSLIGIILAIVALVQIGKTHEGGKGLAIAALIIAIIEIILGLTILFVVMFAFNKALKDNGVNINTQNGSVDVQGKDGESLSIGNAKLPDGFPSDVPIYKPSDIILSLKTKDGYNVTLATSDSNEKVVDFYKSQLPSNGWTKEDTESAFSASVIQMYTKGNNQLVVLIGSDQKASNGKKTTVNLTVGPKESSSE